MTWRMSFCLRRKLIVDNARSCGSIGLMATRTNTNQEAETMATIDYELGTMSTAEIDMAIRAAKRLLHKAPTLEGKIAANRTLWALRRAWPIANRREFAEGQ